MTGAFEPTDVDAMTAEPVRWAEPDAWESISRRLEKIMRERATDWGREIR